MLLALQQHGMPTRNPAVPTAVGDGVGLAEETQHVEEGLEMPYDLGWFRWHLSESNCRSVLWQTTGLIMAQ